jgi:hypothetical protein
VNRDNMKGTMKKVGFSTLIALIALTSHAQTPPNLTISTVSASQVQLNWTNEVATTYRVLFSPDLTTPLSLWSPLEDAFSEDATLSVRFSPESPVGFFNVEIPTNNGVQIFSPTNTQTVSGLIPLTAGAQIGGQLQGVNLYMDDALVGFIDSGGIKFSVDTTHFTNGLHSLYVSAVNTGNGATSSDPIILDFENSVRWLDADSLFQTFVPIDVESDVFPADWSVFVGDANGQTVRTFSGTTSDGLIQTNWDGTDDNGLDVPDQTSYTVTVVVASTGSAMMMSALGQNDMQTPPVSAESIYSQLLQNYDNTPDDLKILYPRFSLESIEASLEEAPTPAESSPLESFLADHGIARSGATPNAGSSGAGGVTSTTVWRERAWNSGQIVLARQKVTGFAGLTYDGVIGNLFSNVRNLVANATVTGDRSTYQGSTLLLQHDGDFGAVNTALASMSPNTREFYYWGHGSPNGNSIGFREGTPNDGIKAKDLGNMLTNSYVVPTNGTSILFTTFKPFDFVFLDGCMTGTGSFPEAFGIPKAVAGLTYDNNHKHKRAFMGWGGTVSLSILDNDSLNWSLAFWNSWLGDSTKSLSGAQFDAYAAHPGAANGAPLKTYGNNSLKWSDY